MRATHDDRRRNMSQTGSSFNIAMAPDKIQPRNLTWIPKMMGWKMYFLSNTVWLFWSMLGRCNMNFKMITMLSRLFSDHFIKVSSLCKVVLQEAQTAKCDLSDWLPSYPKHWGGYRLCCFDMISYPGDVWTSKAFSPWLRWFVYAMQVVSSCSVELTTQPDLQSFCEYPSLPPLNLHPLVDWQIHILPVAFWWQDWPISRPLNLLPLLTFASRFPPWICSFFVL